MFCRKKLVGKTRCIGVVTKLFARALPASRWKPYNTFSKAPQKFEWCFEWDTKVYKDDENPGVGPVVGIIKDAVSRGEECKVEWQDKIFEWEYTNTLRRAPKPGVFAFCLCMCVMLARNIVCVCVLRRLHTVH